MIPRDLFDDVHDAFRDAFRSFVATEIVPHHDAGSETTLTPLSETQAFFALPVNAVNPVAHGSAGTRALGRLARGCRCFSLTFSDLDEACRLVLELVAAGTSRTPAATEVLGGTGREA